jgi:hypothetical protein
MKTMRWSCLCALGLGLAFAILWMAGVRPHSARAATLCVAPGGAGGCYASIQQAVNAATDGDTVQVSQGVYFETVVISKSLALEGGWNDDFSAQDWDTYVTTIDAEGNGSVIRTALPFGVSAITVTIEGFTLMHGDASSYLGWGGGILLQDDFVGTSQFTVRHNVISNNYACPDSSPPSCQGWGGGITVYGGSAVIADNFIGNNTARWEDGGGRGGGIAVSGYANVTIERNTIIANTAVFSTTGSWTAQGGGVDLSYAGDATLRDNEIRGNFAAVNGTGYGGGVYAEGDLYDNVIAKNTASVNDTGYGGGVYAYHTGTFERNTVEGNIASQNGDGTGGGIYALYLQNAVQNTIVDNEATRGGGIYYNTYTGQENFSYNYVARNEATGNSEARHDGGGGIASAANWLNITGNTLISNTAYYGGGVQIIDGDRYVVERNHIELNTSTAGGGIMVKDATGRIVDNLIFDNASVFGGGMYLEDAAGPALESNRIISNTAQGFWGGAGGGVLLNQSVTMTVYLTNNIIVQNAAGSGGYGGGLFCWRGNCNLTHNTIVDNNRGSHQEGVVLGSSYGGSFTLRNNIIAGHSTGVYWYSGAATSDYNDYYDNTTNLVGVAMGAHDRVDDPQFVDRLGGDFHLAMNSPVIDQGIGGLGVAYDFEGDTRPHGAGVDIGADEAYRTETYVSQYIGNDAMGDGSPGSPYATVTKGIYETSTNGTVYVGRGHYLGPVGIARSVNLLGGYYETNWSRDIALYETILDAQDLATVVAIYGEGVQGLVEGFTITGGEGSFYGNGGGIMVIDNAAATIRHNIITGNHAQNGGGGVAIWGDDYRPCIVEANIIYGNVSDGEFVPLEAMDPLSPEQGPEPGGGLFIVSPAQVVNNIIYANTAGAGGDGLAISAEGSIQVLHNTLAANGNGGGQGLLIFGSNPEVEIYNNLIVGHGTGISATIQTEVRWDYNGFYDNGADYAAGLPSGPHDVRGDPAFVNSAAGDYHIGPASAGAGRGSDVGVTVDFDGDARPAPPASPPDIGADEIAQRGLFLPLIRK